MLSPAAMHKVRIYVMERDARRVARALGKLGVVHLSSSVEDSEGRLQPEAIEEEAARCQDLTERLRALMEQLGVEETPRRLPLPEPAGGLDEVAKLVTTLEASVATQADQLGEAEQALADTEEILHELSPYRHVRGPMQRLAGSTFLEVKAGTADRAGFEAMRAEMPDGVLLMPLADADTGSGPVDVLALSSRRRRFAMETVLGEHGFEEKSVPAWEERTPAEVYDEATARKRELGEKIGSLRARLRAAGEPFAEDLRRASYTLSAQAKLLEAERNFGTTWATAVISGWVPAEKTEELRRVVAQAAEGRAVVETTRPDSEEIMEGRVPSCVDQSPLLSPFQRLAQGYGVASYTDIEPTVMFALTFLLMFGIIFGDLGHGICLLVIGLLTRRWARAAVGRDVGHVIAASGAASMLTGTFLQGSFFGKSLTDMGFPLTLGFEPIRFEGAGAGAAEHVMRYVLLAAALGIALISLGVVLNVVSRL
ncbi:MAG: V-type ATPase 116kDa subunit family protein, partial [Planctomycetota bacterium]